jgi:hypothetical protein
MKKLLIILLLFVVVNKSKAQAHIGITLDGLKKFHPDKEFSLQYLPSGMAVASADFPYGTFLYYFNQYGYVYFCAQVPYNSTCVNTQVEIYNGKYTIKSPTDWVAYLDGGIIVIKLKFDIEFQRYVFLYESL